MLTPKTYEDTSRLRQGGLSHCNWLQAELSEMLARSPGIYPSLAIGCKPPRAQHQLLTHSLLARFINWNMPYGAMRSSAARAADHISLLSAIVVTTSPSPNGASSPTAVAVRVMTAIDRARLFVEGRHNDLLKIN